MRHCGRILVLLLSLLYGNGLAAARQVVPLPPPREGTQLPPYAMIQRPAVKLPGRTVISALVFLPGEPPTVAAGNAQGDITLWGVSPSQPQRTLKGHQAGVKCLACSPDGQTLASAGWDDTVRLWQVATGNPGHVLRGHQRGVSTVAFHPHGGMIASGSADQTVRLWDVRTGLPLRTLRGHQGPLTGVAFSPDGKTLATASTDGTIRLWLVDDGQLLRQLIGTNGSSEWVMDVVFSPEGQTLAAAYAGGRIALWEWRAGREKRSWPAHQGQVFSLAFSRDGHSLASGGADAVVRLWETATGRERLRMTSHEEQVRNVSLAPHGIWLASGGNDGDLLVWSLLPKADTTPAPPTLDQAWVDLADDQAPLAYRAVCRFTGDPQAVPLLKARLEPAAPSGVTRSIPELLSALDARSFADREAASRDLARLGAVARDALRQELSRRPLSVEARRRIEWLLLYLENSSVAPDELRATRAVEVLERIGTPEARAVVERLARGAPGAVLTEEARAALQRFRKPSDPR